MKANCYQDFEEAFRGSRDEILSRLSGYEGFLAQLVQQGEPLALDLGCGRGEWLQILHQQGFIAFGIDLNERFIEQCRDLGLQVACADAFEYLRGVPDSSYCLLSAFHLIEHLSHAQIDTLVSEAHRVLRPNGVLLLETPSIDNLLVASKSFYSDPTHTTPIHPEALCFLLQQAGFAWSKAIYLNGGSEIDASHDQITRLFNGVAQDVCIFASPQQPNISFTEEAHWQSQLHRAPTFSEVLYQYNQALANSFLQLQAWQAAVDPSLQQLQAWQAAVDPSLQQLQAWQAAVDPSLQQLQAWQAAVDPSLQQLQAWQAANDLLLRRLERCSNLLRWWLRPLVVLLRRLQRWKVAFKNPRLLLERVVQRTVRKSRRNLAIISTLLKRIGLYSSSMAIYQRLHAVNPAHNPLRLTPVQRYSNAARAEQIDADLARLGSCHREVSK